jgi:hypothetical protein
MSTHPIPVAFSQQESIAREVIRQRIADRPHAPRRVRHHPRAALLLRRLAERLDPSAERHEHVASLAGSRVRATGRPHPAAPHAAARRPWSAQTRRTPHRHS